MPEVPNFCKDQSTSRTRLGFCNGVRNLGRRWTNEKEFGFEVGIDWLRFLDAKPINRGPIWICVDYR